MRVSQEIESLKRKIKDMTHNDNLKWFKIGMELNEEKKKNNKLKIEIIQVSFCSIYSYLMILYGLIGIN